MRHVSDIEIIEFVAGHLTGPQAAGVEGHLKSCAECAERCRTTGVVWQQAGDWQVKPRLPDLSARVLDAIQREQAARQVIRTRSWTPWAVSKVAAAVVVAVLAGHVAARGIADHIRSVPAAGQEADLAVTEALHLDSLGDEARVGLADAVLQTLPASGQEGSL